MELLGLYREMARARAFELVLAGLWEQGLISGEMHLGTGEEAVAAGVVTHLEEGDGLALDHRPTPPMAVRGVSLAAMVREMLGRADGLCRGRGGHMHLFDSTRLTASSGIVGSSAPLAAGFALAAQQLRSGRVGVAFFGEGAANQGMLMEAQNLAVAWRLPMVFVCKDNNWAITTRSSDVTGGDLIDRAKAFGLTTYDVDGGDVLAVHETAGTAIKKARRGKGPAFLRARCPRLDGHMLGDVLVRMSQRPLSEGRETLGKVISAAVKTGAGPIARASALTTMMGLMRAARKAARGRKDDPLERARRALKHHKDEVAALEQAVEDEVQQLLEGLLEEVAP